MPTARNDKDAERNQGKSSEDAIYQACVLRFRQIMMTTMAALLGGLPLAHAGLWFRICADTWRRDCRWTDSEPDADPLHNTGYLFVSG